MRHGTGWAQFPSDEALDLAHSDPVAFKVKSKSLRLEKNQAKERMKRLSAQRTVQAQNLARRKAERETVENVSRRPPRRDSSCTFPNPLAPPPAPLPQSL